jgi:imidazolonepropionase-like amidohydrolase
MSTSNAGELLKMSGPNRDTYLDGARGVIQEGAYADLLLVEGNPLERLDAVSDTDNL